MPFSSVTQDIVSASQLIPPLIQIAVQSLDTKLPQLAQRRIAHHQCKEERIHNIPPLMSALTPKTKHQVWHTIR